MNEMEKLEIKMAYVLRYGVLLSGCIMAAGWLLDFKWQENMILHFQKFQLLPLHKALAEASLGQTLSYMGLGMLILLPILRVLLSTILLIKQRDFLLALIAGLVLVGLLISFSLGIKL